MTPGDAASACMLFYFCQLCVPCCRRTPVPRNHRYNVAVYKGRNIPMDFKITITLTRKEIPMDFKITTITLTRKEMRKKSPWGSWIGCDGRF